ncbi:MAG: Acetyl xylan esterase [Verrucomicrobiales bacterium]|nr:Acetyl xylan esterase [Verrucomicrobiales bacterium]
MTFNSNMLRQFPIRLGALCCVFLTFSFHGLAKPVDVNTPRTFPAIDDDEQWERKAEDIRRQVQISNGLWPMPPKCALNAKIFGKIDREGYSVEKVYFESYPGFFVTGNLYRPCGRGNGPFPAILSPHGHWNEGRLVNNKDASIPGRCIQFARMGIIAFSYDMVGYNDSVQIKDHRKFALAPTNELWSVSTMGVQTWDSIRALDFLSSLPDVDISNLACTGESGGGTQTFVLGAIDHRLKIQIPAVMVSHSMQGGCVCENAPGLRVDFSNMEVAAAVAPRPQLMIGATGDWTKTMMTIEGPSVQHIYELLKHANDVQYVCLPFNHNYNQQSRQVAYAFVNVRLLGNPKKEIIEQPFEVEPATNLLVFAGLEPINSGMNGTSLGAYLVEQTKQINANHYPESMEALEGFKKIYLPLWSHTFHLIRPHASLRVDHVSDSSSDKINISKYKLGRNMDTDDVPTWVFQPLQNKKNIYVLLVTGMPISASLHGNEPAGLGGELLQKGYTVVLFENSSNLEDYKKQNYFTNFYTTYNTTYAQEYADDLGKVIEFAHTADSKPKVILVSGNNTAFHAISVAPLVDGLMVDAGGLARLSDEELLEQSRFVPGFRKLGGLETCLLLAGRVPILLHHLGNGDSFPATQKLAQAKGAAIRLQQKEADHGQVMEWLSHMQ